MFANLSIVGNSKCQIVHLICFISILAKILDIVNNMCGKHIKCQYYLAFYQNIKIIQTTYNSCIFTRHWLWGSLFWTLSLPAFLCVLMLILFVSSRARQFVKMLSISVRLCSETSLPHREHDNSPVRWVGKHFCWCWGQKDKYLPLIFNGSSWSIELFIVLQRSSVSRSNIITMKYIY